MVAQRGLRNSSMDLPVPLPWIGEDCFGGCSIRRWPHIIFQVFWYAPAENAENGCIVLLGEAAAPPVTTLGSQPSSFRLPLTRFNRRAPRNSISFEEWRATYFEEFQRQKAKEDNIILNEQLRLQEADQKSSDQARNRELERLQEAMKQAFSPARTPKLLAAMSGKPCLGTDTSKLGSTTSMLETDLCTPRPLEAKLRGTPAKTSPPETRGGRIDAPPQKSSALERQGAHVVDYKAQSQFGILGSSLIARSFEDVCRKEDNLSLLKLTDGSHVRLPAGPLCLNSKQQAISKQSTNEQEIVGAEDTLKPCYLDVDLAWRGERDSRTGDVEGKLRVDLRSVIAPICGNEGSLRVRVCEVEVPFSSLTQSRTCSDSKLLPGMSRTDVASALASRVDELDREIPTLPQVHPLWLSPFSNVAEVASNLAQWTGSMVLQVSESADLLQRRHMGLLRDAMEPIAAPPRGSPDATKVEFEWNPVQLPAALPMPRCREKVQASAFFEPPHVPNRVYFARDRVAEPLCRRVY